MSSFCFYLKTCLKFVMLTIDLFSFSVLNAKRFPIHPTPDPFVSFALLPDFTLSNSAFTRKIGECERLLNPLLLFTLKQKEYSSFEHPAQLPMAAW